MSTAPTIAVEDKASKVKPAMTAEIGLVGLAVMGQNLALNVAQKGFTISVYNRSPDKTDAAEARAKKEGLDKNLKGYKDLHEFVQSLAKPRRIVFLVKAGAPVDSTIASLAPLLEEGDILIDGGNEWYENTERRAQEVAKNGLLYIGMGVSGGEEGARNGPSMMPGGDEKAYKAIEPIITKVAAQVDDGPCTMHIGPGGAGNYVKMVHNGIEYGDMQLISEAYDVLKTVGGFTNEELATAFNEWNNTELSSFLMEITTLIFKKKDEDEKTYILDKILDKTGMKGTGKWTIQQAAEMSVAAPTIAASLDARFVSGLKSEREKTAKVYEGLGVKGPTTASGVDKKRLLDDVRGALYASKICSYAQGLNIIRAKSIAKNWGIDMGSLTRIWKGGCIIRAGFLDDIKQAYERNKELENLILDDWFAERLAERQNSWRETIKLAITSGVGVPGMTASLGYFDSCRRARLPANLVQAQRDFFGSHTYERIDKDGSFHTVWDPRNSADSITTSAYNN